MEESIEVAEYSVAFRAKQNGPGMERSLELKGSGAERARNVEGQERNGPGEKRVRTGTAQAVEVSIEFFDHRKLEVSLAVADHSNL